MVLCMILIFFKCSMTFILMCFLTWICLFSSQNNPKLKNPLSLLCKSQNDLMTRIDTRDCSKYSDLIHQMMHFIEKSSLDLLQEQSSQNDLDFFCFIADCSFFAVQFLFGPVSLFCLTFGLTVYIILYLKYN